MTGLITIRDAVIILSSMVVVTIVVIISYVFGTHNGQKATGFHDEVPKRDFHQALQYDLKHPDQALPMSKIHTDPSVFPGAELTSGSSLCTVGAVGDDFIITAGHCTNKGDTINVNGNVFDVVDMVDTDTVSADWAVGIPKDGDVDMTNAISVDDSFLSIGGVVEPVEGMEVCANGVTTGWVCGEVSAVYGDMFDTSMCIRGGDSGSLIITPRGEMVGILAGAYIRDGHQKCVDGYNNHAGDSSSYATAIAHIDSPHVTW